MPGVKRSPRNSLTDRPSGWRLALRRQRWLLRPAMCVGAVSVAEYLVLAALHPGGTTRNVAGGPLVTMRERISSAAATSGLRVTDVVIEGRANTPEPLLRAAIGVSKGDPILGFSLEATRARIETIPWVERATVERRLPGTLVVNLQERRPYAVWQHQGKFVLVDRTGQVVADQVVAVHDTVAFRHLPLIVGQGAPGSAAVLLDALRDRPLLAEKISAMVRVGERRWNLRMLSGTDVLLPEGHEVAALDRLMQLQQEHLVLDRPLVAIDLRLPDRLVFRPRPEAKDDLVIPPLPPGAAPAGIAPAGTTPPGTNPAMVPVIAKKPT